MEKIKRFLDCYINITTCNLQCHYCYIAQLGMFKNKINKIGHTPDEIRSALSVNRLGGICLINLCAGGETLLSDEVLPIVIELLKEGHYVMIVTNGTLSHRFDEIVNFDPELRKRLFVKFSYHYLELKRLDILDKFFGNVLKMRESNVSFTVEITPSDELIPHISEVMETSIKYLGALCHVTIARDDRTDGIEILSNLEFDDYISTWGIFNSELFSFKSEIFHKKRKEFCYAGDWSAYIILNTGEIRQCYCGYIIGNLYDNIDKEIPFSAIGNNCKLPHCYNGHSFLGLGVIPEIANEVKYSSLRNRETDNYGAWLGKDMAEFMSQKLKDNNKEYTSLMKLETNAFFQFKYLKYILLSAVKKIKRGKV